ncbi:MAG: MarR family transcriptional regulator [Deltaproteobacteria bacterium]|nr:MarR family transcriptional regulator [Deltaproteobacteria bacterium]
MKKTYSVEKSIGFIIYRTALAMKATLQRTLKERGLAITPEQYGILHVLREEEGLSQREIGNILFKDKPNVSRMLDALERNGLILRQPTDRRRFAIFLTPEGKTLIDEILPIGLELSEQAVKGLLVREIEALEGMLNKIYGNIA